MIKARGHVQHFLSARNIFHQTKQNFAVSFEVYKWSNDTTSKDTAAFCCVWMKNVARDSKVLYTIYCLFSSIKIFHSANTIKRDSDSSD